MKYERKHCYVTENSTTSCIAHETKHRTEDKGAMLILSNVSLTNNTIHLLEFTNQQDITLLPLLPNETTTNITNTFDKIIIRSQNISRTLGAHTTISIHSCHLSFKMEGVNIDVYETRRIMTLADPKHSP
jgi:hypothetical protein